MWIIFFGGEYLLGVYFCGIGAVGGQVIQGSLGRVGGGCGDSGSQVLVFNSSKICIEYIGIGGISLVRNMTFLGTVFV